MSGLLTIMDELATVIRDTLSETTFPVQVEPRMIFAPEPLSIDIYPGAVSRDDATAAFGDISGGYLLTVRARINKDDTDAAQDVLLALMDDEDPLCLGAAIHESDLDGSAASVSVTDPSGFLLFEPHVGVTWTVLVIPAPA